MKVVTEFLRERLRNSPLRWWFPVLRWRLSNFVSRKEVIQRAINKLNGQRYLEIGVDDGVCFCAISVPEKIGVDPIRAAPLVIAEATKPGVRYFALTSDEFFEKMADEALAKGVDVVFIDGLHTYQQAYQDCMNALKYLNPGGVILLHDCLPISEEEAQIASSYEDAKRINRASNWNSNWLGDVWKAIIRLRAQHYDLDTCVLDCDHGLGVVVKGKNNSKLDLSIEQIEMMEFADLVANKKQYLGLCKPKSFLASLAHAQRMKSVSSNGRHPV
jgi:hypothetical protein